MKQRSLIYKAILLATISISSSVSADFVIDAEVQKPVEKPVLENSNPEFTEIKPNDFLQEEPLKVEMPPLRLVAPPVASIEEKSPQAKLTPDVVKAEIQHELVKEEFEPSKPVLPYGYVSGWAENVPLSVALSQIVPSDWELKVQDVNLNKSVSWNSDGEKWKDVLLRLVDKNELSVVFEDSNKKLHLKAKEILVKKPEISEKSLLSEKVLEEPKKLENEKVEMKEVSLEVKKLPAVDEAKTSPVLEEPRVWVLDSRMTLKENVTKWAKDAGWNPPIWDAVDYPVYGDVTFTGEFAAPDGPLATLIEAYKNSKQPLKIRLTTKDRVISVSNKNYVPVNIDPSSARELAPEAFK